MGDTLRGAGATGRPGKHMNERLENSPRARLAILLAGILLSQIVLYGPSLIGTKILLPLDILAEPGVWMPVTPETAKIVVHDGILSDLVYVIEPERQFVASELRAGRWPTWMPGAYAGKPVLQGPWLSPLSLILAASPSPIVLAWHQLFAAIVAGLGFYVFCRRALGVRFWPAVMTAWTYPMTGFFVFWLGYPNTGAVYWLPWLMVAIDGVVRRPGLGEATALSLATCATLCTRQLDIAAQALIVSALYGAWRAYETYGRHFLGRPARKAALLVLAGWTVGFSLAAPYAMPIIDYAADGARIGRRAAGVEERGPGGIGQLPLLVLPDANGGTREGSFPLPDVPYFQIESTAVAYAGLIVTLFLAPLAWRSRRHRSFAIFATVLAYLALGWCLDVGGIVTVLRLPGLRLLPHNRFVFAASFAILAMAAAGLDSLREPVNPADRSRWLLVPAALVTAFSLWSLYRAFKLPEPLATELERMFHEGKVTRWIKDASGLVRVQEGFARQYLIGAGLGFVAAAGYVVLALRVARPPWMTALLAGAMFFDMLWFAHDRSTQSDPSLYYPRISLLDKIARVSTGRVVGFDCLPPNLAQVAGLRDVRGNDGVDPAGYVQLLRPAAEPERNPFRTAELESWRPRVTFATKDTLRLSPILDLLGVEYVVARGPAPGMLNTALVEPDYWALRNPSALPRAFVPRRVEHFPDDESRLARLGSPLFDPREVAYVESPVDLPDHSAGGARLVAETPAEVTISLGMDTPGLVVLADRWDPGWTARLNGSSVPVLRTNHALRGVVVPQGSGTLRFRYRPPSRGAGLLLLAIATVALASTWLPPLWRRRRGSRARMVA